MSGYGAFAGVYDALTADVDYASFADFIRRKLDENNPARKPPEDRIIADLACGTGNLSVLLAGMGYDVIGVDSSPEMLTAAREKSPEGGILYLNQKMECLDLYGTVDAAVCALDSLNHVTDAETLLEVFRRVALFLEPGGVFIFDANTPYKHREILANNAFVYDLGDIFCVWQNETAEDLTEITLDFFVGENGVYHRSSERFFERGYAPDELRVLLNKAGLEIIETYDGYTDNPPGPESERVVYVASLVPAS